MTSPFLQATRTALRGQTLVCTSVLSTVEATGCLVTILPFVSLASTSTVADAYRWLNHTVDNRTVVEDGYYYLNNFDNILNSFGEHRTLRQDTPGPLSPQVPEVVQQSRLRPPHTPRLLAALPRVHCPGSVWCAQPWGCRPGPGLTQPPGFLLF